MLNKCINCCKWITCKESSENKLNCENFKFKIIEVKEGKYGKELK